VAGTARGLPAAGTVYWWAGKWEADGSTARMHDDLRDRIRTAPNVDLTSRQS